LLQGTAFAAQLPSLFRGIIVVDSPVGVRVVSVEDDSQASRADVRPEDLIVRIHGEEIHSIDEFAALSQALKGRAEATTLLLFRNGKPLEITLHLYSYPVLDAWGVRFVPDHDVRFAEARVGLEYWARLGWAYEDVNRPADALNAYLNGLHNAPSDTATAMKVSEMSWRLGREHLASKRLPEGVAALEQAVTLMQRRFEAPLSDEQLVKLKAQLETTLAVLRK
jgi:hypothetical protein